ncbi:MAG: helicase-related protein [Fibrobacterales bacterium]
MSLPNWDSYSVRQPTPALGMSGGVQKRGVVQFRMPRYPLALISTDVLQEGEDLHLFCDRVVHYGISFTSTSMEQKIGRVDRVSSLNARKLSRINELHESDKIQVQFPYLRDTVEVYQMNRLFNRMNGFIDSLHTMEKTTSEDSRLYLDAEISESKSVPPAIETKLETPYPVMLYNKPIRQQFMKDKQQAIDALESTMVHFSELVHNCFDAESLYQKEPHRFVLTDSQYRDTITIELNHSEIPGELLLRASLKWEIDDWEQWREVNNDTVFSKLSSRLLGHPRDAGGVVVLHSEILFGINETQPEEVKRLISLLLSDVQYLNASTHADSKNHYWVPCKTNRPWLNKTSAEALLDAVPWGNHFSLGKIGQHNDTTLWTVYRGTRHQHIQLDEHNGILRLSSCACTIASYEKLRGADILAACMSFNEKHDVVGFRQVDGQIRGEVHQPVETLQIKELVFYLVVLAEACDSLEFIIEGGGDAF